MPLETGGIAHYWRDNDDPALPWIYSPPFATDIQVHAVSLIQSNYGFGNLEVIARTKRQLAYLQREADRWSEPHFFAEGVGGIPTLIQSRFGKRGNFKVVTPLISGGLAHYWRDNDRPEKPWNRSATFATDIGNFEGLARSKVITKTLAIWRLLHVLAAVCFITGVIAKESLPGKGQSILFNIC